MNQPNKQKQLDKISKFLSFVLRHKPESIGIILDREGWTGIDLLIKHATMAPDGMTFDRPTLLEVVVTNGKQRFEISSDGSRIRAVQGHSTTEVDRSFVEKVPPAVLYHGTARKTIDPILDDGLLPMSRQYVHLSEDYETALEVGQRHGKAVVLEIYAGAMHKAGIKFYQAENGVWLTEKVGLDHISVILKRPGNATS
jgi:putative RNA 2'-phosphotransferase